MPLDQVCTKDVMDVLNLKLISGEEGIGRHILTSDISRPGLEMAGYFTHYPAKRVQLLGKTELSFFEMLQRRADLTLTNDTYFILLCEINSKK